MARFDPRFNAFDVLRIVEKNLTVADKRLVFAWFFSTIPIKEPKVDVVGILLDLLSAIPVAGTFAALFQISITTAQVAADIAELFKFEFEEEEVELARLKFELAALREDFDQQRQDLLRTQLNLDAANERVNALLATQTLLEDEIRDLLVQLEAAGVSEAAAIGRSLVRIGRRLDTMLSNANALPSSREVIFIKNGIGFIREDLEDIRRAISG